MNGVSDQERQPVMSSGEFQSSQWTRSKRLMVSLPIFIILLGILVSVSNLTASSWNYEPTGQTIETLASDTSVTFDNPSGKTLAEQGDYEVTQRYVTIDAKQPSTGEIQHIKVLIREPKGAGNSRPGVVFMHGAGYGTCDNSFGDMALALSSAGFVTAVPDKPVWSTNDATRDYPGSAAIYDQVINMLRDFDNVDASNVGIYATSESTWISSYLLGRDPDVAFQVLLSPMVYSPRHSLGFLAAQDFALVGAHDGYQSIVRRAFNIDAELFGLTNLDLDTLNPQAYSIPTLVAYGTKDVMTAQVEGTEKTSERVAGTNLYQSIAVPSELRANSGLTIYLVVLHASMVLLLLVIGVLWLIVFVRKIWAHAHRRRYVLGLRPVFKNALITLAVATMATFVLFGAGLGDVVVVWAWSRVFMRLIEEATNRGLAQWPPRKGVIGAIVSGRQPVLASTRFGRVMFWITAVTMLYVLLVFAFWGLFIY